MGGSIQVSGDGEGLLQDAPRFNFNFKAGSIGGALGPREDDLPTSDGGRKLLGAAHNLAARGAHQNLLVTDPAAGAVLLAFAGDFGVVWDLIGAHCAGGEEEDCSAGCPHNQGP